jgi:hypothetical protein
MSQKKIVRTVLPQVERRKQRLTWNLPASAPEYTNTNQTSTKSPVAAATLEIISERLATLSTLKRLPGEKPNTVVSTLWSIIRS